MSGTERDNGWMEAAIAWEVCASLHRQYCKGKDALFTTRQSDFVKHAENARGLASHGQAPAGAAPIVELELPEGDTRSARVGYAEMQNGVLHLCICVEDAPAAPSTPASPTIEGESK